MKARNPHLFRQICRPASTHSEPEIVTLAPPLPTLGEDGPETQNIDNYDPKKESLEEFLNIRFAENFPTINDDKNPTRDVKNFPRLLPPIMAERTRLYVIPDSWFQYFYDKTGVTGPYVFTGGLLTFLFSKEWWIIEHEFVTGVSLAILTAIACKKAGPPLRNWYCSVVDVSHSSQQ